MKRLLLFILILLSSIYYSFSCGFYPYGEDVRFSMFNPYFSKFTSFQEFNYSSNYFGYKYELSSRDTAVRFEWDENILLWSTRYNNAVPLSAISDAVYDTDAKDFVPSSSNAFISFLFKKNDTAAISYIKFAKQCNVFNTKFEDPWERYDYATIPGRKRLITEAIKRINLLHDNELIKRYAFIAIRLAYYNGDKSSIQNIYARNFSDTDTEKNILNYWSMYFLCMAEKDSAKVNFYAAQVFAHAVDKRFMVSQQYNPAVPVEQTLRFAKTASEKSAVWLLAGIKNPGKALECMKNIYALEPDSEGLSFLLLRELNKLEDWIYTPLYTEFAPSIDEGDLEKPSFDSIYKQRIHRDRLYAGEVLAFIRKVNNKNVYYAAFWQSANVYLLIMKEQYQQALNEINQQLVKDAEVWDRLSMLKALCAITSQPQGAASLTLYVKQELLSQKERKNYKFIFAIAKELEFRKNTTDAAVLMSTLNTNEISESDSDYEYRNDIYWRTRNGSFLVYGNFYTNYFDYMDYQYTPEQIKALINRVENEKGKDAYSTWAYKRLHKEICLLYDLTGTKYLRKDDLSAALYYYKQVPDSLWSTGTYIYLDANPFYTNFYSEHAYTDADTVKYNKVRLVQTLKKYLSLANDVHNKDRDYYYFLVANCYFNMTHYGNSWIMKRYQWSSGELWERQKKKDVDYFQANYAKKYYLKAKECSKTKKFAALCLRMAGRCEKYLLMSQYDRSKMYDEENRFEDVIFETNKYYRQLKKEYPNDYDDLISNCESFTAYFAVRR